MKLTKKIIALVMAVVMLSSVFVISASALTYSPTNVSGEIAFIVTADKTEVKAGEVVTFSVAVDPGSKSDFGAWNSVIVYNSADIAPTATDATFRTWKNDAAAWINPSATVNHNYPITQLTSYFTTDESNYYNKAALLMGTVYTNGGAVNSAGSGWTPSSADTVQLSFTMQVSSDVKAGDEIWVGLHEAGYKKGMSYIMACGGQRYNISNYNLTNSMVKLTVVEDKEPSPVFNNKSQIRFDGPVDGDYAPFSIRTRGYISADDLTALCGGNVTEEAITAVGFVYFAGEDMDLATAAEVAKNGDSGAYVRKPCYYVQNAGTEYRWACLVTDPTHDGTLQSVAYITVGGETYITDAVQETSFATLYENNKTHIPTA